MTSVTTATTLSVIVEKSMYALRMSERIGRADSSILTIVTERGRKRAERQYASEAPPQIVSSWPVIAAAAVERRYATSSAISAGSIRRPKGGTRGALATRAESSSIGVPAAAGATTLIVT